MSDGYWPSVAREGGDLVAGARGTLYAHPYDDYSQVVEIMEAICPDDLEGTVLGAIYQMVAVKLSRLRTGFDQGFTPDVMRDHFVDACGYLDCLYGAFLREHEYATDELLLDDEDDDE